MPEEMRGLQGKSLDRRTMLCRQSWAHSPPGCSATTRARHFTDDQQLFSIFWIAALDSTHLCCHPAASQVKVRYKLYVCWKTRLFKQTIRLSKKKIRRNIYSLCLPTSHGGAMKAYGCFASVYLRDPRTKACEKLNSPALSTASLTTGVGNTE